MTILLTQPATACERRGVDPSAPGLVPEGTPCLPTPCGTGRHGSDPSPRPLAALWVVVAVALLGSAALATTQDEPQSALSRPGDGSPVCGLGKAFHAGRRAALRAELGEGLVVLRGLPETRGYVEFRQDKAFWYLTGIESPDAALVMDAASGEEILFLPARDARKESWDGELWDAEDDWVKELTGFTDVRPSHELPDVLTERLADRSMVWTTLHPAVTLAGATDRARPFDRRQAGDPLDGRESREQVLARRLAEKHGVEVQDLADALNELRRIKQPEEIEALRRAGRAGARAMAEAIRSTAPGVGEWELDALIGFMHQREGGDGQAYHAIVGSGPNSNVLHYSASSRRMGDGEVLLIDAGAEVDHYTTDITRTWPVNGRFSERQAELYDAVLAAQEAGIAACRPGATMREVDRAANDVLRELGFGDMIRHGVCHYIGMEVHDVGVGSRPFEPGVAFTVEPGLYELETDIGIRIEDVVVITEDGCKIVTRDVPVAREAMEALVSEPGVLDWLGGRTDD